MNPIRSLVRAVALATLASTASFTVQAAGIPIGSEALESHVTTQVTAIDLANRQVTVKGPDEKKDVTFQLTEKAKALPNLKVGAGPSTLVGHWSGRLTHGGQAKI